MLGVTWLWILLFWWESGGRVWTRPFSYAFILENLRYFLISISLLNFPFLLQYKSM
ncbi:hypothetical protein E1A91_A12G181000v1 [Gossypium mustelinum]|uniref:Uncharacterized protein n=1 Tax=Gossypium mustelinum TaxID=34275 RepID=A0A5D2WW33_GOSMU|nr:hypothetical protein E1A91_A12G181000v1 [Gossypium mustelinum]